MKRTGYLFEAVCSFENLYEAFKKAFKGSRKTQEACRFYFNLENELLMLKGELERGIYQPAKYSYFRILDPKERTISVAPFRDRVVHHAVVGVLEPIFDKGFIYDSYATRRGKGTHRALKRAQRYLRGHFYYLKGDISKYFDSIDHAILMTLIRRRVKDGNLLNLVERIVSNSDTSRGLEEGKGLPIGNLTSQFFANVYLDPLDHFVKENLWVKCYIRYMDDMVVFSHSKDHLKGIMKSMEAYLAGQLKLTPNPRATLLNSRIHGLPFLGFRIFPNVVRVKRENLKRIKKRLHKRTVELRNGLITEDRYVMSVRSTFEHVSVANSFMLRTSILVPRAGIV